MALKARNDRLQGTENCVNVCCASQFLPAINSSAKPFCWEAFLLAITWKEQAEMLFLGENGTWGMKSFRKWPLLWDCFVPPWRGLPEPAVPWGCPACSAETLRKCRNRNFCLFLLFSPGDLQNLSLTPIVLLRSQPPGQSLPWQLVCKKALLFVSSFREEHCWHSFKDIIGCIWSYQAFLGWASLEAWSSGIIWGAALQEVCFALSNRYENRYKLPNCCPM